jgi:hypothetical protein
VLIKLGKYAAYATPVVTDEEVLTPTVSDEALEAASNQRPEAQTYYPFCRPTPSPPVSTSHSSTPKPTVASTLVACHQSGC